MHDDEHPSPSAVFPSSHCSSPPRFLSPHADAEHSSGPVKFPPAHPQPHSIRHDALHPSPPALLPSSHCFDDSAVRLPSPQFASHLSPVPPHVQYGSAPPHENPVSTMHAALHPSSSSVFPSSHSSLPRRIPSPQNAVQSSALQSHPHSTVHWCEQPSYLFRLPSSQDPAAVASLPTSSPSPQFGMDVPFWHQPPVYVHPSSTSHVLEHPSPSTLLPSSHSSTKYDRTPSPHVGRHVSSEPPSSPVQLYPHSTVQEGEHPSYQLRFPSSHFSLPARTPSPHLVLHASP